MTIAILARNDTVATTAGQRLSMGVELVEQLDIPAGSVSVGKRDLEPTREEPQHETSSGQTTDVTSIRQGLA